MTTNEHWNELLLHDPSSDRAASRGTRDDRSQRLLSSVRFVDYQAAHRCLQHIADGPKARHLLVELLPHLLVTLSNAANPDRVLVNLERFTRNAGDKLAVLRYLANNPRAVEILVTLFAGSQFLTEILLRNPEYFDLLVAHKRLSQPKSLGQFCVEAQECVIDPTRSGNLSGLIEQLDALRRFHRWELLRIGACDLLDLFDLPIVTQQLSHLADSVVQACLNIAAAQSRTPPDGFVVIAMGKLGGNELNYSSDIDLLFLALPNAMNYRRLGERLIDALTRVTGEGFLYRVDMRLRPWGQVGALVSSVDGYVTYLKKNARLWEKQALLKARVVAGDETVGNTFLGQVTPLLLNSDADSVRTDVYTMRQRTEGYLRQRGREWGEIKLGEGSIRDIEFVAQYLQLAHGTAYPQIHSRNTLDALRRLYTAKLLSTDEYRVLADGYTFLRTIEHHLQMMHYRQTHTLPDDTEALVHLARRLGFLGDPVPHPEGAADVPRPDALRGTGGRRTRHIIPMLYRGGEGEHIVPMPRRERDERSLREGGEQFLARYEQYGAAIRTVYLRHLEGNDMKTSIDPPRREPRKRERQTPPPSPQVHQHLARMDASYETVFSDREIRLHATLAEHLDNDHLVQVNAVPLDDGYWRVTVVGYDYPGELSLICGLLFVHGFSIHDGNVFTYEPLETPTSRGTSAAPSGSTSAPPRARRESRRKIVDVFTVSPVVSDARHIVPMLSRGGVSPQSANGPERGSVSEDTWTRYTNDLASLLRLMHTGRRREARGELAKRVAIVLPQGRRDDVQEITGTTTTLYPIEIEIDNAISEQYTVLFIDAPDTIGFLYEFTNALALNRIYIARVTVESIGDRAHDILYVTDASGHKITSPGKQRELRAATVLIKHFTHLLPHSPNPESALLHFREFIGQLFQRSDWPDELASLERPEVLDALARLLGISEFLWDDFLRMQHANLFPVVRDVDALVTAKSKEQLQAELEAALQSVHDGPQPPESAADIPPSDKATWRTTLNAFKDREMFRIDMRHILGHTQEFWDFSRELTALTEVVVNAAYHLCHEDQRTREAYGTPCLQDGRMGEMTVCALGKCGGRELGFASDIELIFIYAGNGQTTGPHVITTAEFYERVVQTFIRAIQAKREGIFEVDLRLRPYGKSGSMAVSLESFRRYFAPDGPAWAYERQALVKLRPIAGDAALGLETVKLCDEFVYNGDPFDVNAMRAMRERQIRHLVTGGTFNAKFSPGGLVDVEYLVEGLQITHGHSEPGLRLTNIREAMVALHRAGILAKDDYTQLRRAHTFLRWLIDGLRIVHGNAKDLTVPPADSEAFAFLARRLRYGNNVSGLRHDLAHHTTHVQELNAQLL